MCDRADAGDLLVLLCSVPNGLAARTLAALGVDAGKLAAGVEAARSEERRSPLLDPDLSAEIEHVHSLKEEAIEAQEFDKAADLRDRERRLRGGYDEAQNELLEKTLQRLGLD